MGSFLIFLFFLFLKIFQLKVLVNSQLSCNEGFVIIIIIISPFRFNIKNVCYPSLLISKLHQLISDEYITDDINLLEKSCV